jgi:D-alanyl-D-alanine carboxypeptidase
MTDSKSADQMAEIDGQRQQILEKLQSILDESIAIGVPGISAAIQGPETVQWSLSSGYADISAKTPVTQSTAFGVGSITKVFVAVVILQLVEEEKLRLADQAGPIIGLEWLDDIQNPTQATVDRLLSHTSGIFSWEDELDWQQHGRGRNVTPEKIWAKTETLEYVRQQRGNCLEIGKFHYANTNYTMLGLIIERVTQNTAEAEIRRRILQPLNMMSTYLEGFELPEVDRTPHRYHWATDTFRVSPGVSTSFKEVRPDLVDATGTNLSVSWAAGGMISTPTDLLKFAAALRSGTLLSPASMNILMAWTYADDKKDMGRGIFRLKDHGRPGTWIGHNGDVLGFTAAMWWDNDSDCGVAILSNVGASHAGTVPSSAAHVAGSTPFLDLASELANAV